MPVSLQHSFISSSPRLSCYNGKMNERISTAGVAVKDGRVLVARRMKGGSLSEKWEFPGGKQRWGETDADTLRREYMEELAAEIEVGEKLVSFSFENGDTLYHLHAYLIAILSDDLSLAVHTEMRWVDAEELRALDMGGSDGKLREAVLSVLLNTSL